MFDEVSVSRFWNKVDKSAGPDACWPWTGAKRGGGYGVCTFQGRQVGAHRVSLLLKTGRQDLFDIKGILFEVPSLARHSCDNKICVNPAHLQWGTPSQNTCDRSRESFAISTAKMIATRKRLGIGQKKEQPPRPETKFEKLDRYQSALEVIANGDCERAIVAREALIPRMSARN